MNDGVFRWTEADVVNALGLTGNAGDRRFRRVATDTRTLRAGDLYVALRGVHFDGHDFLARAAMAGAQGAVVRHVAADAPRTLRYFVVQDTLEALGQLANWRRVHSSARVVGVVGSNGKTTTKELLRAALASEHRVHATRGNENNQVGVPSTILAAPDEAQTLVLEMGTSTRGEIERLSRIAQPDAAVITAIGEEHLQGLGTVADVLEEETAILHGLSAGAMVLVAEEPRELAERVGQAVGRKRMRIAGFSDAADLRPDGGWNNVIVERDGSTRWHWRGIPVHLQLPGCWNVRNALLALGLAEEWGVDPKRAVRAVQAVRASPLRGEWKSIGALSVLADCYNANPASVWAAVELLATLPPIGPKVAVLGTMRELGPDSEALHERTAALIKDRSGRGLDLVVATGAFAQAFEPFATAFGDRLVTCIDPIEAYYLARPWLRAPGTLLLKASRQEALESWLPHLERDFSTT